MAPLRRLGCPLVVDSLIAIPCISYFDSSSASRGVVVNARGVVGSHRRDSLINWTLVRIIPMYVSAGDPGGPRDPE